MGSKINSEPYNYQKNRVSKHASHKKHLTYWIEIFWQNLSLKALSLFPADHLIAQ